MPSLDMLFNNTSSPPTFPSVNAAAILDKAPLMLLTVGMPHNILVLHAHPMRFTADWKLPIMYIQAMAIGKVLKANKTLFATEIGNGSKTMTSGR